MESRLVTSLGRVADRGNKRLSCTRRSGYGIPERLSCIRRSGYGIPERLSCTRRSGYGIPERSGEGSAERSWVGRAFLGRPVSGPIPLEVPGRRVDQALLGRLASGFFPFGALGSGRLVRCARPGPKVPTVERHLCVTIYRVRAWQDALASFLYYE